MSVTNLIEDGVEGLNAVTVSPSGQADVTVSLGGKPVIIPTPVTLTAKQAGVLQAVKVIAPAVQAATTAGHITFASGLTMLLTLLAEFGI